MTPAGTKLGLSRSAQIILKALQEYGAYVGDFSGALLLYAENSPEAQAYWKAGSVLDPYVFVANNATRIDMTNFRVLKLGALYEVQ